MSTRQHQGVIVFLSQTFPSKSEFDLLHDAVMVGSDVCCGAELKYTLLGHLSHEHITEAVNPAPDTSPSSHAPYSTYLRFRLANVLLLKQELPIEVADIYGVQVNLRNGEKKTKRTITTHKLTTRILTLGEL